MTINIKCFAKLLLYGILLFSFGSAPFGLDTGIGSIVIYDPNSYDMQREDTQTTVVSNQEWYDSAELENMLQSAELLSQNVKTGISNWYLENHDNVKRITDGQKLGGEIADTFVNGILDHVSIVE